MLKNTKIVYLPAFSSQNSVFVSKTKLFQIKELKELNFSSNFPVPISLQLDVVELKISVRSSSPSYTPPGYKVLVILKFKSGAKT